MSTAPQNTRPDLEALGHEVEASIREAWGRDRRERWRPTAHWASNVGHPCVFYLWARMAKWDQLSTPDVGLLGIFRNGKDAEVSILQDLRDAGYEVVQSQVGFEDKSLRWRGKVDGFLRKVGHPVLDKVRPFEVKSMHPSIYEMIHSFQDLLISHKAHLRKYVGQVLAYGWLTGEPLVGLVLRDKSSRATRVLWAWIEDWLPTLQAMVDRTELVNRHLDAGTEPEPPGYNADLCDLCEARVCCPAILNRQGAGSVLVVDNATLDGKLERIEQLKPAARECNALEESVKKTLAGSGAWPEAIGGEAHLVTERYRVTCTTGRTTRQEYPADVKPTTVEVPRRLWMFKALEADK